MWDKSKKLPNLCSKIAPASPGVSDKKSPAPGGLGASIPRPRPPRICSFDNKSSENPDPEFRKDFDL